MYNRHKIKEEDEESLRRQAYLDSLNRKKELIKNEFDKLQDELKFDELTIKSDNDIHFKNLLNDLKRSIAQKQEKLFQTENTYFFIRSSALSMDENFQKEANVTANNTSFTKSFYKNKILETISYKKENNPESLKKKLLEIEREINDTKHNIETEIINKTSIQSKVIELENSKKKMLFLMNDLNFAKRMTFKRFNNINTLLFNAKTKKKLSLLHLNNIKTEMGNIKTVENDFFKQKFTIIQQEKHDIEKEQTELSKVLLQIDNAKMRLAKTEKELTDLEYQEAKLNDQKMEAFYVKEYIGFFQECENLFLNEEIQKFSNPKEEILNVERVCSSQNRSFSKISDGGGSQRSPIKRPSSFKKRTKKISTISPKKIKLEVDMNERLSVVRTIFEFHQEHEKLDELVQKISKVYSDLIIQSNSLSTQYEEIMALKNLKTCELERESKTSDILIKKNSDLLSNISTETPTEENHMESDYYSLNAGILKGFYDSQLTTVNRLKQDVLPVSELTTNEIEQIKEETFENEKFVFSAYLNVSSKILLLSDIILLISEVGEHLAPNSLTKLCENIKLKIINKKQNQNKNEKVKDNTLMAPINDINFDKITASFGQYFPLTSDLRNLRSFYNLLKSERAMGCFLNMDLIAQFFKSIHNKYSANSDKIVEKFDELKSKAYEVQNRKIQYIFENFIHIFDEISRFKENLTDAELHSARMKSFGRKNSECLSSFNLQNKKKQIDKIKIMTENSTSSDEEKKNHDFSLKKNDTFEQISYSNNYKPSHYFNLDESSPKKDEEKSEGDIFEENRNIIKSDLMGKIQENDKKENQKNELQIRKFMQNQAENDTYLKNMLKISSQKDQIERLDKKKNNMGEPILEFQQQLKTQKEKTIYNLYHTDKGYNPIYQKAEKQNNFKIKNKVLSMKSRKTLKTVNQTTSTIMPISRAQTSSTNTKKRQYFLDQDYALMNYNFNGGLDYDVLFNKTEDEKYGSFSSLNYQSQPTLHYSKF